MRRDAEDSGGHVDRGVRWVLNVEDCAACGARRERAAVLSAIVVVVRLSGIASVGV